MNSYNLIDFEDIFFQEYQKQMLNSLPLVAKALFWFYSILAFVHPFVVPPPNQWLMCIISAMSAVAFIVIATSIQRKTSLSKTNIISAILTITTIAMINTFVHLILTRDVLQTTNILLIYIALSLMGLTQKLFIAILITVNCVWLIVTWLFTMMSDPAFIHFLFTLAIGSFIASVLSVIRFSMLKFSVMEIMRRRNTENKLEKANNQLQKIANIDPLTGLSNRRAYDIFLKDAWVQMSLEKSPLSLIIADIDHFKTINDAHGHQTGDEALVAVGKTLAQCVRTSSDLIARYGGEEFIAIIPNMPAQQTQKLAERMRIKVSDLDVNAQNITISLGSATITPDDTMNAELLFHKADQALYEAKTGGRNKAIHAQ